MGTVKKSIEAGVPTGFFKKVRQVCEGGLRECGRAINRGGDTMARMMGESTRALREKYLATGEAGPTDIENYIRNANDQSFWSVDYSTVSVVAVQTGESAL